MSRLRAALLVAACLSPFTSLSGAQAQGARHARTSTPRTASEAGIVRNIIVQGNRRIDAGTIRAYMLIGPGQPINPQRIGDSLKTLYATGLFQNVSITRQGDSLVVQVVENPLVHRVAFEGNHALDDKQLQGITQLRTGSVFTPAAAEADRKHILDAYAAKGRYDARVEPEIIRLPENQVDVIYKINEGPETLISRITFVGNRAFSEGRLAGIINSRPARWWAFLSTADEYSEARLAFDKELLRRFYLQHGYIDFDVVSSTAALAPDRKSFFVTFVLDEGARYRISKIDIHSSLQGVKPAELQGDLKLAAGDWYNGDAVGRSVDAMQDALRARGYAFAVVTPQIHRDPKAHSAELAFNVGEGPRVYVERIAISGNTRTEDGVIRREFRIAEGDAYNDELIRRSRQRLEDLNFFNSVKIQTAPGSAPDEAVLNTVVSEKATGQFSLGGGYSTDAGALLSTGISESNFIGTGINAGVNGVLAQRESSIDLSVTDPYFLGRNLLFGGDTFLIQTNYLGTEPYNERRVGFTLKTGLNYNEHLQQVFSYSLVSRGLSNLTTTDFYIEQEQSNTLLSQISQVVTLDYRNSKVAPTSGGVVSLGTDFAGAGGEAQFIRARIDGTYYVPLDFVAQTGWYLSLRAGTGYLFPLGRQESVLDRFYLGGDNLRGFEIGGVGPHSVLQGSDGFSDAVGGRFIWTQSSEVHFPLPLPPDLGISGRAFVDVGSLTDGTFESTICNPGVNGPCPTIVQSSAPRVGVGVGITWKSPFGPINIDLTPFVIKRPYDTTQVFRFGFGTNF